MSDKQIDSQQVTLDEKINKALSTVDDKGKIQFEEGVDPLFKRAVLAEKKAKDNQASFTKSRQELATVRAEREVLENQLSSATQLPAEQLEELEDLKYSDPDAYFEKRVQYEADAKATVTNRLKELKDEAGSKAVADLTLSERQETLQQFEAQTGLKLTDDIMANDVPPRLQNQINDMPFGDYLAKVADYLSKGKVVKQTDKGLEQTNINRIAGGQLDERAKPTKNVIL